MQLSSDDFCFCFGVFLIKTEIIDGVGGSRIYSRDQMLNIKVVGITVLNLMNTGCQKSAAIQLIFNRTPRILLDYWILRRILIIFHVAYLFSTDSKKKCILCIFQIFQKIKHRSYLVSFELHNNLSFIYTYRFYQKAQ